MTTRSTHSPSLHSATKASVPKSHLRKEAESILKTTNASVISNASVWTPADDKSIAHVDVTKSPSDEFPLPAGWARYGKRVFYPKIIGSTLSHTINGSLQMRIRNLQAGSILATPFGKEQIGTSATAQPTKRHMDGK
jgi:hypothetical protein